MITQTYSLLRFLEIGPSSDDSTSYLFFLDYYFTLRYHCCVLGPACFAVLEYYSDAGPKRMYAYGFPDGMINGPSVFGMDLFIFDNMWM